MVSQAVNSDISACANWKHARNEPIAHDAVHCISLRRRMVVCQIVLARTESYEDMDPKYLSR